MQKKSLFHKYTANKTLDFFQCISHLIQTAHLFNSFIPYKLIVFKQQETKLFHNQCGPKDSVYCPFRLTKPFSRQRWRQDYNEFYHREIHPLDVWPYLASSVLYTVCTTSTELFSLQIPVFLLCQWYTLQLYIIYILE